MSEFKVGDKVVLKNSSQDKVMVIQDYSQEFIRAYWDSKHYSFAHECNFRPATLAESRNGYRIDNPCKCCNGHGEVGNMLESFACPECNGDRVDRNDLGDDSHIEKCTACNGRGEVGNVLDGDTCPCCKGSGVELETLDRSENYISTNCKVTEAHINEADKLNRLG